MIIWPCMLKLDGDDELIYLPSQADFIAECHEVLLSDTDNVIDSRGNSYLIKSTSQNLKLISTERVFTVDEVTSLLRAHEFQKATLCLTKIHFLSVSDAIRSLAY